MTIVIFLLFASLLLFILNEITKIYIKSKNVNNNSVICLINLRTWVLKKINIFYALFSLLITFSYSIIKISKLIHLIT